MTSNRIPGVSRESFESMATDSKLDILYDVAFDTHRRVMALEKRKRLDKIASITGGIIGGFVAVITKGIFWK